MLSDKKLTSQNIGDNNSIYKSILHKSIYPFIIVNQSETIQEINSATEMLFGYSTNEFEHLRISDLLVLENDSLISYITSNSLDNNTKTKAKGKRKNQQKFPLEFTVIHLEKEISGMAYYCLFLTELNETVENTDVEIINGDAVMRNFINNLPFVVFQMTLYPDNSFQIGFVNYEMINYSPEFDREAVNANNNLLFHRVHPDDKQMLIDSMKYKIPFTKWEVEYRVIGKDGEVRWTKGYSNPILLDDSVTVSAYTCLQDITANKLAEEALIKERGLLRTMIDNLPVAVFVKDKFGRKLISNKIDLYFMGVQKEEDIVGKTDLELFNNKILFKGYEQDLYVLKTGEPIIEDPDITYNELGEKIDLLISKFPIKDDIGNVEGLIGIGRDITNQKSVEEQLKLVDFAFRNSAVSIFLVREDGSFYDINEMAYKMLGYSKEVLLTLSIFDINPNANSDTWNKLWHGLQQEGIVTINSKGKKKDGTVIDVEIKSTLINYGDLELNCAFVSDITEKKKALEQLELADFIFRKISTPIIVGLEDGRFLDFNQAALELYGYSREEMEMLETNDLRVKKSKSYSQLWGEVKAAKQLEWESIHMKKDGTVINVECAARFFVYGGMELSCTFIVDVTKRKRAEESLKRSNERYEYATMATSDAVWEADLESNTLYLSKNYSLLFGHEVKGYEDSEDNPWRRNVHPDDLERILNADQETIAGMHDKWQNEYRLRKKNGEYALVMDRGFAVKDENGKTVRLVGAIQDITARKLAEQEKEQLVNELTQNNMELKQFSYITTHNLRAPLTNLIAISKMLNTDEIKNELTLKLIDGFKRSTYHLNETLNDLINILIIKENKNLAIGVYQFQKILDKVAESIETAIVNSRTIINVDFSKAKEVHFNGAYLESIFLNLITNSIKYADFKRDPVIEIKTEKLEDNSVILTFKDNGLGMNMERVKHRIFGLYQRFHNNIDSKGIGLYLIHSQITALGGYVSVWSEEGKGTIFTIGFK